LVRETVDLKNELKQIKKEVHDSGETVVENNKQKNPMNSTILEEISYLKSEQVELRNDMNKIIEYINELKSQIECTNNKSMENKPDIKPQSNENTQNNKIKNIPQKKKKCEYIVAECGERPQ
jgi:uncharacterized coiled-coil DUF342 family protein